MNLHWGLGSARPCAVRGREHQPEATDAHSWPVCLRHWALKWQCHLAYKCALYKGVEGEELWSCFRRWVEGSPHTNNQGLYCAFPLGQNPGPTEVCGKTPIDFKGARISPRGFSPAMRQEGVDGCPADSQDRISSSTSPATSIHNLPLPGSLALLYS